MRIPFCGQSTDPSKESVPLKDGAEVFVVEVHAIKKAIMDTHHRGLFDLDINSNSRSALQVLNNLVPRHSAIAKIKYLVKQNKVQAHMHWIQVHVKHTLN